MLAGIDFGRGLQHAHRVLVAALAAEYEGEAEHQDDRHQDIPRERASIAHEFAVAGDEHGVNSLQHFGIMFRNARNGR